MIKNLFSRNAHIAILFAALVAIILIVGWYAFSVILLSFAGVLLAIFLHSLAHWVNKKTSFSHSFSLTIVISGLLAATVLLIWWLAPLIIMQIDQLIAKLPDSWDRIEVWVRSHFGMEIDKDTLIKWMPNQKEILSRATEFFSSTFGTLTYIVFFFFLGIYLAYDPQSCLNGIIQLFPKQRHAMTRDILYSMGRALRLWLLGKLLSMFTVGVFTSLGLWILGVPLAFTLGLIAALLTFIPNIGPVLGAIPAILIALLQSPFKGFVVTIFYIVLQIMESYFITPLIQKKTMELPQATILFGQLLFGFLAGGLGLALATPLTAVLIVLVRKIWVEQETI